MPNKYEYILVQDEKKCGILIPDKEICSGNATGHSTSQFT